MYLSNILDASEHHDVKQKYEQWFQYMNQHIEFWLPESELHTKYHSARVLLHALLIGYRKGLTNQEMDTLGMAAIFHDSRRLDDGLDTGHGARAAEYYKEYCQKNDLQYDEITYYIIYYHDQDDSLGLSKIKKAFDSDNPAVLSYEIFKDADALDRFRLGPDGLDVKYLRTVESRQMVDFAKQLVHQSGETDS